MTDTFSSPLKPLSALIDIPKFEAAVVERMKRNLHLSPMASPLEVFDAATRTIAAAKGLGYAEAAQYLNHSLPVMDSVGLDDFFNILFKGGRSQNHGADTGLGRVAMAFTAGMKAHEEAAKRGNAWGEGAATYGERRGTLVRHGPPPTLELLKGALVRFDAGTESAEDRELLNDSRIVYTESPLRDGERKFRVIPLRAD